MALNQNSRDFLFTEAMVVWMHRLAPSPEPAVLIAAWGHTLRRWEIPRDTYPKTTPGYHAWRKALAEHSAKAVDGILAEEKTEEVLRARVLKLIQHFRSPCDEASQLLEDADCLAFLELKLDDYLDEWDEVKTIRILKGTLEKMSPKARERAGEISYSAKARGLIAKAVGELEEKS